MDERLGVGEVARVSGLTVRTLHHYDSIGLLVPSGRSDSGYRVYSQGDLDRLAQIVAYRACGLPLAEIADLLSSSGTARMEHLRRQIAMLDQRLVDAARQREVLGRELEAQQMGIALDREEYFAVFGEDDPRQYADEVRERWGDTDAYAESARRTSAYTAADWTAAKAEQEKVASELADCLTAGLPADSTRTMDAAEAHRRHISRWYYDCTYEIHAGLADMYVGDPRFTAYYENRCAGLANYVHAAIYANALRH